MRRELDRRHRLHRLADAAELAWDGAWRPVLVSAVGNEPLLRMAILAGHELRIVARPGGAAEISPLP